MDVIWAGINRGDRLVSRLGLAGGRLGTWVVYLLTAILVVTLTDWVVAKPVAAAPAAEEPASDDRARRGGAGQP